MPRDLMIIVSHSGSASDKLMKMQGTAAAKKLGKECEVRVLAIEPGTPRTIRSKTQEEIQGFDGNVCLFAEANAGNKGSKTNTWSHAGEGKTNNAFFDENSRVKIAMFSGTDDMGVPKHENVVSYSHKEQGKGTPTMKESLQTLVDAHRILHYTAESSSSSSATASSSSGQSASSSGQ